MTVECRIWRRRGSPGWEPSCWRTTGGKHMAAATVRGKKFDKLSTLGGCRSANFWDGRVFRGALERLGSKLSKTPLKTLRLKNWLIYSLHPPKVDNLSNFLPRTVHIMFKFSWTKCNIFLRRLFAFTFSCLRFYKETVSVKLRQIELNVKLFVWLFSLKMAKKIRHIKEIKCKWKECLGSLEGTKLFVHNISKTTRLILHFSVHIRLNEIWLTPPHKCFAKLLANTDLLCK